MTIKCLIKSYNFELWTAVVSPAAMPAATVCVYSLAMHFLSRCLFQTPHMYILPLGDLKNGTIMNVISNTGAFQLIMTKADRKFIT